MLLSITVTASAQIASNDSIRLGAIIEHGQTFPIILLPEFIQTGQLVDPEERARREKLRNDIYTVYPYAIAAAAIFKDVNAKLDQMPDRRSRKRYLKTIDKTLDQTFKQPLKDSNT